MICNLFLDELINSNIHGAFNDGKGIAFQKDNLEFEISGQR